MHGLYPERSSGLHSSLLREASPQVLVDNGLERPARASGLGLKPRGNVFIQSQGCPHSIKMLSRRHRDVQRLLLPSPQRPYAAATAPPYILAGHSIGGIFDLDFARLHPNEVAGIVLVDSTHPEQTAAWRRVFPKPEPGARLANP